MLRLVNFQASIEHGRIEMTYGFTTVEKYNQLSDFDRHSLCSVFGEKPEVTLAKAERQLELFEIVKNCTCIMAGILLVCFLANSLLKFPKSISDVILIFVFLLPAFGSFILSVLLAMLVFKIPLMMILGTRRQKFRLSVEQKWKDIMSRQHAQIVEADNEKQRIESEISQRYQRDFDVITNYFAQRKTLLMPKGLLQFSVEELAEFVISRTLTVTKQKNLSAEKRREFVSYYRHLSCLIPLIVDDEVFELEETLERLNNLVQDKNVQESIKSDLLNEYARISMGATGALLKNSREKRTMYVQKFEETSLSLDECK